MTTAPEFISTYPLDRDVAATRNVSAPWRVGGIVPTVAVLGLGVLIPLVIVGLGLPRHGDAGGIYSLVGESILGAIVVALARPVARAMGGWRQAFGVDGPRDGDIGLVIKWFFAQMGARFAVAIVIAIAAPHLHAVGNVAGVEQLHTLGKVLVVIAAVVVAPAVEELAFRGLLLRAIMRRLGYWPAAGISSLVFALLHAPEVSSLQSALVVVIVIYVFGLLQCQLVRRYGRLTPAIGVHATTNLVTLVLALSLSS